MVPKRQHGSKYKSSNLPSHTPMIGLGCSSFSTFFDNKTQEDKACTNDKKNKNGGHDTCGNSDLTKVCQSNAQERVQKSNPIVQSWIQTIHYAIENGITLLDTAPWYGHGTSEVVIGYAMEEYSFDGKNYMNSTCKDDKSDKDIHTGVRSECELKHAIQRKDLIINTKVGRYDSNPKDQFDFTYETTIRSVKRSIERMKCVYIDVIQIHDPEFVPTMQILMEETVPALLHCRDELQIVKAIGLTGYPLEVQYHILNEVMKKTKEDDSGVRNSSTFANGKVIFDQCLTYCHFNLHSQALFTKPIQEMDIITNDMRRGSQKVCQCHQKQNKSDDDDNDNNNDDNNDIPTSTNQSYAQYCKHYRIPLMAAAPLSMGLLTHNPPPEWHPALKSLQSACHDASMIAKEHNNVDLPTLAIIYALVNGDISCTLLGMANKTQVDIALDVIKRVGDISYDMNDVGDQFSGNSDFDGKQLLKDRIQSTLKQILTDDEMNVMTILMDDMNGPFANVWSNGEFEWDGILEAEKFWSTLNTDVNENK